jgi:hypothetical protein
MILMACYAQSDSARCSTVLFNKLIAFVSMTALAEGLKIAGLIVTGVFIYVIHI